MKKLHDDRKQLDPLYYCPACEKKVFKWLLFTRNIGHGKTRLEPGERLCPHCRSFERTRQFSLYIDHIHILDLKPRFLHFAPEQGLSCKLRACLQEKYVTVDLYREDVDQAEDITKMTFDDNSFDFIYCSNVLEHVEDDASAIKELYRVLSPGGTAMIQVPIRDGMTYEDFTIIDPAQRAIHFGQNDHVRCYGRDIAERLSRFGFVVEEFFMLDLLKVNLNEITKMNLSKREYSYACSKR